MSKTWKWILGIVLVLVLIGGMFAVGFFGSRMASYGEFGRGVWNNSRQLNNPGWRSPMTDDAHNRSYPMMDRHFAPFFGGFFLLGGLVKFAIFVGLLYGAYWLGKRNARIALDPSTGSGQGPKPGAPAQTSAPVEAIPEPAAAEAEPIPAVRRKRTKTG